MAFPDDLELSFSAGQLELNNTRSTIVDITTSHHQPTELSTMESSTVYDHEDNCVLDEVCCEGSVVPDCDDLELSVEEDSMFSARTELIKAGPVRADSGLPVLFYPRTRTAGQSSKLSRRPRHK